MSSAVIARRLARALLVTSLLAVAVAPLLLPAEYDLVAHTTSEAAAQGVPGAWLARVGFVLFGLGVLARLPQRGELAGHVLHGAFAVSMLAVAVFPSKPWDESAPHDATLDLLHSVFASTVGFAFILGVATCAWLTARTDHRPPPWPDVAAVLIACLVPVGMLTLPHLAGALQRTMFLTAYAWYLHELQEQRQPA